MVPIVPSQYQILRYRGKILWVLTGRYLGTNLWATIGHTIGHTMGTILVPRYNTWELVAGEAQDMGHTYKMTL